MHLIVSSTLHLPCLSLHGADQLCTTEVPKHRSLFLFAQVPLFAQLDVKTRGEQRLVGT